ncbi:MAG: hypothetical protein ACREGR_02980 [Minisyncoccia bacterium]
MNRRRWYLAIFSVWLVLSTIIIYSILRVDSQASLAISVSRGNASLLHLVAFFELLLLIGWVFAQYREHMSLLAVGREMLRVGRKVLFLILELVIGLYVTLVLFASTSTPLAKVELVATGVLALLAIEYFSQRF